MSDESIRKIGSLFDSDEAFKAYTEDEKYHCDEIQEIIFAKDKFTAEWFYREYKGHLVRLKRLPAADSFFRGAQYINWSNKQDRKNMISLKWECNDEGDCSDMFDDEKDWCENCLDTKKINQEED